MRFVRQLFVLNCLIFYSARHEIPETDTFGVWNTLQASFFLNKRTCSRSVNYVELTIQKWRGTNLHLSQCWEGPEILTKKSRVPLMHFFGTKSLQRGWTHIDDFRVQHLWRPMMVKITCCQKPLYDLVLEPHTIRH